LSFINSAQKLNELPEKARQFSILRVQCIRLRDFSKSLAIAQNGSVAAFFFFPLIQFMDSVKKTEIQAI